MGKKRRILFYLAAGIFLAWFAWLVLTPHEPVYQGKPLSVWLEEANESEVVDYDSANPEAVNAIRQIGIKALPELVRLVATKDTGLRKILLKLNEKQSFYSFQVHSLYECDNMAAAGFYILGSEAKTAVPELMVLLSDEDPEVRSSAAWCLGLIGPTAKDAVPALITAIGTNHSFGDILSGSLALGKIGPEANAAIPFLRLLPNDDPNWLIPPIIQAALVQIGGDSISPYIDQLKDTSNRTNWIRAARIIGLCPNDADPAIPLLIAGLANTNRGIVWSALHNLGYIHKQPDVCIPAIIPFLQSPDIILRKESVVTLHKFGTASKVASPEIILCLTDPEFAVRVKATNALRDIDPEAAAKAGIK